MGIILAYAFKDNRAFCKYICPITVFLKPMADYAFEKMIKSDDRATSMEIIAEMHGYSIGSGMLSENDVILQGLTAIKLKEEDPLTIDI